VKTRTVTKQVAEALRRGEPMSVSELVAVTSGKPQSVWYACKSHPLIYIDHWRVSNGAVPQWVAVYGIIDEPEDTPRPVLAAHEYARRRRNLELFPEAA
jgi:hypothetical protein